MPQLKVLLFSSATCNQPAAVFNSHEGPQVSSKAQSQSLAVCRIFARPARKGVQEKTGCFRSSFPSSWRSAATTSLFPLPGLPRRPGLQRVGYIALGGCTRSCELRVRSHRGVAHGRLPELFAGAPAGPSALSVSSAAMTLPRYARHCGRGPPSAGLASCFLRIPLKPLQVPQLASSASGPLGGGAARKDLERSWLPGTERSPHSIVASSLTSRLSQ